MSVSEQCLLNIAVLFELEGQLWWHLLNIYQHGLLQACTFLVHLTSDFVFGCKIWLKSKLHLLFGQADDNLVQNEDLSVEKASFIQVDILLDLDGFVSRQTLASELQVKLSFVKHCMHITQLNSITFELGEDLNG